MKQENHIIVYVGQNDVLRKLRVLLIILFCVISIKPISLVFADPPNILWTKTYGFTDTDVGYDVHQTSDNGFIIAGYSRRPGLNAQVYILRVDSLGDTLWTRTYGGSEWDQGDCVVVGSDGNYGIVGHTCSYGSGNSDVWLLRVDTGGDTIWTSTYGGSGTDGGTALVETQDNGFLLAGYTAQFGGGLNAYIIRTDTLGDTLWTRAYGGASDDAFHSVDYTSSNGYIAVGFTESFGAGNRDVYAVNIDSSGDTLWSRTYGSIHWDEGFSVQSTSDDGYIIAGLTLMNTGMYAQIYIVRIDSLGDTLWTGTYSNNFWDIGYCVRETSDGGFIVVGQSGDSEAGPWDIYMLRLDSNGDSIWTYVIDQALVEGCHAVQVIRDGGYIITGQMGYPNEEVCLIRIGPIELLTPNGGETWEGSSTHDNTWHVENPVANHFQLELSTDGGTTFTDTIASNIPADSTRWSWVLPTINCMTCRAKIAIYDSLSNLIAQDQSDNNFAIIDTTSPLPFSLIAPPDSAIIDTSRPTFIWHASYDSITGLEDYEVYINDTLKCTQSDTGMLPI